MLMDGREMFVSTTGAAAVSCLTAIEMGFFSLCTLKLSKLLHS